MGQHILLESLDVPGIETFAVYRQLGGYASVEKALTTMTPEAVVEEVKKSGLRGRGGAGFPTGMKWGFLDKASGKPCYLVCNADESEPGTFKDRVLMDKIPHRLIEGVITSSYALGSRTSYIYVRGELMWVIRKLEKPWRRPMPMGFWGAIFWAQAMIWIFIFIPVAGPIFVAKIVPFWNPWKANGAIPE